VLHCLRMRPNPRCLLFILPEKGLESLATCLLG
jgi:hypothetical protein